MVTAKNFFSQEQQQQIEAAVREVEQATSGEIVPMVVDASYDYPRAEMLGGGSLALATAIFLSWAFGGESIWVFLPLFLIGYPLFRLLIRNCPSLKRRLIHPAEIDAEVEEKALVSFIEQGLHKTRDHTGILILISLFEHRVQVLADRGINAKAPAGIWDAVVRDVTSGIKDGTACAALCREIRACGAVLAEHFPARHDDTDELPNLIVE
jgi:putative membrane protein